MSAGVLPLAVLVLVPAFVAGCGGRPADAVTTLRTAGPGVRVVTARGQVRPAVDGEQLSVGMSVRTAGAGAALLTGGRVTTLGPASEVEIAGRSRYLLDDGTVVVDHRVGPDATVVAGPVSVGDLGRTSVRVERGFAVRVAVYDGGGARITAGGESLTVLALHEADVPGAELPADAPPLSLRDDHLDVVAAPALVALDVALDRRAAQVDGGATDRAASSFARRTATVVPASDISLGPFAERVLPAAMAGALGGDVSRTYAAAAALRAAGGSWGVVAELVGARLAGIQREIALLLSPAVAGSPLDGVLQGTGPVATLDGVAAGLPGVIVDGLVGTGATGSGGGGSGGGSSGGGSSGGTGSGGGGSSGGGAGGSGGSGAGSGGSPVTSVSAPDPVTSAEPQPSTSTGSGGGSGSGGGGGGGGGTTTPVASMSPTTVAAPSASSSDGGLLGTVLGLLAPSPTVTLVVLPTGIPRL